ncbi:LysM peptidoglycan-binding domain-containing protein [Alicyclobacillus mengziensis]|uniref:LysM peptidoglycan-binding domain-containing protein n=1 Tax=Alicyclobacillus mengziensis TaxID=2931921 RepID=A0A9X7Z5E6_9BACL|nr:LysM domain-containing protein [Alicyclobacillus mengziensis]QSO46247.1 LysM peptidoglycan-binding domain-containing protein [Alicyclobacillus mengziensis]
MKKYVVREGDTMWSIAEVNGIRPKLLMASNPQVRNPNQLKPGTVIIIPELTKNTGHGKGTIGSVHPEATVVDGPEYGGQMATGGAMTPPSVDGNVTAHTGPMSSPEMPVTDPNAATTTPAHPGKSSKMPPFFGFVWPHAVQPGETWYTIQQKYNVQMQHLLQMNPGLANRPLRPGDLLYVPGMVPSAQLPSWASQTIPVHPAHTAVTGAQTETMQQPYTPGQGYDPTQPPYTPGQGYDPTQPPHAPGQGYDPTQPPYTPGQGYDPTQPPYTPGQGYDPTQPPYTPGQGYDPTQPPYTPGSGSQWSEPYGPHQHNPFRWDGEMYAGETWKQSSDWAPSDEGDENGAWRGTHFADSGEKYYQFAVPENPTNEISVYLGEDDEGPEPES